MNLSTKIHLGLLAYVIASITWNMMAGETHLIWEHRDLPGRILRIMAAFGAFYSPIWLLIVFGQHHSNS